MESPAPYYASPFSQNQYLLKRNLLKLVGAQYHILGPGGDEILTANQKGWKLKAEIRISSGGRELVGIFARQVIDFSAAYDVVDISVEPNVRIGVFKRKGWKSLLRDEWIMCDAHETEIGSVHEDNMALAVVRRFLTNLVPQNYDAIVNGQMVADFRQNFNPFTYNLNIMFPAPEASFDRRLGIAAAVLLASIEGRQRG
jgi:hypothetical protein